MKAKKSIKKNQYVDGFITPVPKKKIEAYKKIATLASKVWLEHGALEYIEAVADDVKKGKHTSFPQSVKMKSNETVFFSWVVYKNRAHRDRVVAKVMSDERLQCLDEDDMLFDGMRMVWGGFKVVVN